MLPMTLAVARQTQLPPHSLHATLSWSGCAKASRSISLVLGSPLHFKHRHVANLLPEAPHLQAAPQRTRERGPVSCEDRGGSFRCAQPCSTLGAAVPFRSVDPDSTTPRFFLTMDSEGLMSYRQWSLPGATRTAPCCGVASIAQGGPDRKRNPFCPVAGDKIATSSGSARDVQTRCSRRSGEWGYRFARRCQKVSQMCALSPSPCCSNPTPRRRAAGCRPSRCTELDLAVGAHQWITRLDTVSPTTRSNSKP